MSARTIAFRVLLQVERADAYLNLTLDSALKSAGALPPQEAALATELAYGVTRRALALDAALAAHSNRPLKKLENAVLVALRLGAYQLLYLDRIPAHAAVDETVKLAKQQGLSRAAGFINAVLRKLAQARAVPLPDEPLERIAVEQSHPLWLVRRWAARFGAEEAAALCRADNQAPPLCVRVNSTRATRPQLLEALQAAGQVARPTAVSPVGVVLESPGWLAGLEPFKKGLFQVQDEAAQLVGLLPEVRPGMRILDACAAPGGKSCHLAERLRGEGELFAVDLYPRKLEKLQEEARRLGLDKLIHVRAADVARPLPFEEKSFDLILLDAPCSGLGTLRRHPELRYRRAEADIGRLAALQEQLAGNVLRYLKPGGQFVYAVCSTEPEEGEARTAWLREAGLTLLAPHAPDVPWDEVRAPEGGIATFPHRHQADGFFGARLALG